MTALKPGLRLRSAVCTAEVMIVKGAGDIGLTCGGAPMAAPGETVGEAEAAADQMDGCQVGKRYVNADESLEVLCIKPGQGSLAAGGEALAIKEAKKLPSSD